MSRASRVKASIIFKSVCHDAARRFGLVSGQIGENTGGAKRDVSELDRSAAVFDAYLRYGGEICGRRILEIGAGDNILVALRFLAAGATQVVCFDRFQPLRDTPFHQDLYRRLRDRLSPDEARKLDASSDKIRHYNGHRFERAPDLLPPASFDWIVSNAVLEEIHDLDRAFAAMDRLLAPGGRLVHKIDLSDYGLFSKHADLFHPLEFLTLPDAVYRSMTEASGQPNRRLIDYYRNKMAELRYDAKVDVVATYAESPEKIRPRLAPQFRSLTSEDLAVRGIYLAAKKPICS
jgi:SAM-dependent methyltransferase